MAACLVLIGSEAASAQCVAPAGINNYEAPCGMGLLQGQSFTAPAMGYLDSIKLAVCTGLDAQLEIREYNGATDASWDNGTLLGEATAILVAIGTLGDCLTSTSGFDNYIEHVFSFEGIGLLPGQQYVMTLVSGTAATACNLSYSGGKAFNQNESITAYDLAFEIFMCEATFVLGCMDETACNYNSEAEAEDGSCMVNDCFDVCGGSGYSDPDCGCLPSIADAGNCLGCMDTEACNYDASATVEDGSCTLPDCNDDCGGSAELTECGCMGGATGLEPESCVDGCITNNMVNGSGGCSPGLLFGQKFSASTTGLLKQVRLKTCCALNSQVVIRQAVDEDPCSANDGVWNSGEILGTSDLHYPSCAGLSNCLTSASVDGYQWTDFSLNDIPVQVGVSYIIELVAGVAIADCGANYENGNAYNEFESKPNFDLVFAVNICAGQGVIFGCNDLASCNFDFTATDNDGSCLFTDCNGDCGGTAESIIGCGCVEGLTGIPSSQCVNGLLLRMEANDDDVCTTPLYGQTFTPAADGFLERVSMVMSPLNAQSIRIVRIDGPLSGTEVGTASRLAEVWDACVSTASDWNNLNFDTAIPLQAGSQYQVEFLSGSAIRTCNPTYDGGHALNNNLSASPQDLAFRMMDRIPMPGELVWGCTDETACNYDTSHTHEDSSCLFLDCNGDCGGSAYMVDGCGCVGGATGYAEAACYGCTHPLACNYDTDVPIDDGSCSDVDCNGECAGTAFENSECGCIGGSTGIDPGQCLDKCQGEIDQTNYTDGLFNYEELGFSQSGQTFTASHLAFLTATRVRQLNAPTGPLTFNLRAADDPDNIHDGTLLASGTHDLWEDTPGEGVDVFIEWDEPVLLTAGTQYVVELFGIEWSALRSEIDGLAGGASFDGGDSEATRDDLFIELFTCDDLMGCTDLTACNFDDWATADAGNCWAHCNDPAAVNYNEAADPACTNNDYCNYCDPPFDWDITTTDFSGHVISCPDSADGIIQFQVTDPNLTIDRVHFLRDGYYQSQSEGNSGGYINLIPGLYAAVGINDEYACRDTIQIIVDEPTPIMWSGLGMTVAPSGNGSADGEVEANWSGGASTLLNGGTLLFANIDPSVLEAAPQFTTTMNGDHRGPAPAGWQLVVARDANGCWAEGTSDTDVLQFMDIWGDNPPFPSTARVQLIMIPFSICD